MAEFWDGISGQFLQHYPKGVRILAVAGADAERSRAAGDGIADALRRAGVVVERTHVDESDETALRERIAIPFRSDRSRERVLVLSGPAGLLSPAVRGMWHFSVWQLAGDEAPHSAASTLVDMSDPAQPTLRYADYCALPSSYGA
ncbi:hypothetical protein ACWGJP_09225 [Microbacterium sp. NPDC055903]